MEYEPFKYCIDSPKLNQEINLPLILISGWIIVNEGSIILNPTICSSGIDVHPLTSVNRPDVEAVYPNHYVLGFHQYLSIFDLALRKYWSIEFLVDENKYNFPLYLKISSEFLDTFSNSKSTKLQKIINLLHCPICENAGILNIGSILQCSGCTEKFSANKSNYNFLSKSLSEYGNVKTTKNVSANNYDPVALNIIEQCKNGIILDNGCGLRNIYYDNVVNFEIVDYPTTDILGIGEKLPFKTDVFDAVFSLSVLEHVKNPFECAQEIVRVLKPGGILYVAVPFLQPFHGYPDHYYNMTSSGLKNVFSNNLQIIECSVPLSGLPIWCLSWFLNSYIRGLPDKVAEEFKEMKVSDLLNHPTEYLDQDFVRKLSPQANEELACVNCLIAKKM